MEACLDRDRGQPGSGVLEPVFPSTCGIEVGDPLGLFDLLRALEHIPLVSITQILGEIKAELRCCHMCKGGWRDGP